MTNLESVLKSRDIILPLKFPILKAMVFPVILYRCEKWTMKKVECWRIDAFELWFWRRLLRVPWTARRSNQLIPKGSQSWIFIGRTDSEAPILWPPDAQSRLTGKDSDTGRVWRQDEMVGWHHQLNWHEFEQALGAGDGHDSATKPPPPHLQGYFFLSFFFFFFLLLAPPGKPQKY